MAFVNRKD